MGIGYAWQRGYICGKGGWQGRVHGKGACIPRGCVAGGHVWRRYAWQERWPLQQRNIWPNGRLATLPIWFVLSKNKSYCHSASRALDVRKTRRITTEPQQCYLQLLLFIVTSNAHSLYIESVQISNLSSDTNKVYKFPLFCNR